MTQLTTPQLIRAIEDNMRLVASSMNPYSMSEVFERVDKLGQQLQSKDPIAHLNHVNAHLDFYLDSPMGDRF